MKRCKRARKRLAEPLRSITIPSSLPPPHIPYADSRYPMRSTSPILELRAANDLSIGAMARALGMVPKSILWLERGTSLAKELTLKKLSKLSPDPLLWISQYHAWIEYHRSIGNRK